MTSVAGQIRIDLLAEVAQFNAGMRSAGNELGTFQEQAAKVDRQLAKMQAAPNYAQKQRDIWVNSMRGGGPLTNVDGALGGKPFDIALHNEVRWKNMVPWGNTARVELSREAALTAAAVTGQGKQIASSLREAVKEIGETTAESYGMGGVLSKVGKFAMGHPVITGAAMAAGYVAEVAHERDVLAREVHHASLQLGQGAADTSKMMAMGFDPGMLSKFQKSVVDKTPEQQEAFSKLRLDPFKLETEPLKQALEEVGASFEKYVTNPYERASVAMHLFGRSGGEVIATLLEMEEKTKHIGLAEIIKEEDIERTKAWDFALKDLHNTLSQLSLNTGRQMGIENGMGTGFVRGTDAPIQHPVEAIERAFAMPIVGVANAAKNLFHIKGPDAMDVLDTLTPGIGGMRQAWIKEDEEHKLAPMKEAQKRANTARETRLAIRQRKDDALAKADVEIGELGMDSGARETAKARQRFSDTLKQAGASPSEIEPKLFAYDREIERVNRAKDEEKQRKQYEEEGRRVYESTRSPYQKYQDETAKEKELLRQRVINEEVYAAAARKHLEDYYREAANLDVKQLRESLKTPAQLFSERKNWINDLANNGGLSRDEANRLNMEGELDLKKKLGIKDTYGEFEKQARELWEAFQNPKNGITPEMYGKRMKELRRTAADEAMGERPSLTPMAAVGVASREEHAALTRSFLSDQATSQRKGVLEKLAKIEENTRNRPTETIQSIR